MFEPRSRYHAVENAFYRDRSGRQIEYKRRRFRPPPESLPPFQEVTVAAGERLDLIAARLLGDPEQFWRIADLNQDLDPFAMTQEPGRKIRVPQG